jgi:hypothetical protein
MKKIKEEIVSIYNQVSYPFIDLPSLMTDDIISQRKIIIDVWVAVMESTEAINSI